MPKEGEDNSDQGAQKTKLAKTISHLQADQMRGKEGTVYLRCEEG